MSPFILAFIASAALGAVIGLVRQRSEQEEHPKHAEYSGVRTFTLWGVLGCVGAFLSDEFAPALLPVALAAVALHQIGAAAIRPAGTGVAGATTLAASLLTMCAGALIFWRYRQEAVLLGALTAVLLGLKRPIHAWTRRFTDADVGATLKFVAITGIILPLVPNQEFGPFDAFNPFKTWRMVVLISGLGFLGYVLMRLFDTRAGVLLTGLLGGIASSTATTLAFSRRSRAQPALGGACAMGVALACAVMLPRLALIVGLVNAPLARQLLVPLGLMLAPALAFVAWSWLRERKSKADAAELGLRNPLDLWPAVKFALIYAAITFAVKAAEAHGHLERGLLPLAFLSGLTDVDAIALSLAGGEEGAEGDLALLARGIVLAAVSNTLLKAGLAAVIGRGSFRWQVLLGLLPTAAAGLASLWLLRG
ncbi:MAG TPA: MgtC/SapB family protein [Opitutaceae bacterium]|nr:MgtC/SapB family protein [Opitutaceae bacterium]